MNWQDYRSKPDVVLTGKSADGTRLVLLFTEDYRKLLGKDPDISCSKCFRRDFNNFINTNISTMSKKQSVFKVLKKYEGLAHPCSKNVLSTLAIERNPDVAIEFYVEHPNGAKLFEKVPKNVKKLSEAYAEKKEAAQKEAEEAAKKAEQEKKAKEDLEKALSEAQELGVEVTTETGKAKALSTLQKDIEAAKDEAAKKADEQAKKTAKNDAEIAEQAKKTGGKEGGPSEEKK